MPVRAPVCVCMHPLKINYENVHYFLIDHDIHILELFIVIGNEPYCLGINLIESNVLQ